MICEGLVTTRDRDGTPHLAPMGPTVAADGATLELRPFRGSATCDNLLARRCGVFHVTDDAALIARAAVGPATAPTEPAATVAADVLVDCCRWSEFRVVEVDETGERLRLRAEVTHAGRRRDHFGFNRAKFAVVEGAILATRVFLFPRSELDRRLADLAPLVEKTGGEAERDAWRRLTAEIARRPAADGGGPA